jgi:hypothetical protein
MDPTSFEQIIITREKIHTVIFEDGRSPVVTYSRPSEFINCR